MNNRSFTLKYGRRGIRADTSRGSKPKVLTPHFPGPVADAPDLIRYALENPIDSPKLGEVVYDGDKVVIVASDSTRSTASNVFLPILVGELNAAGIPDRDIDIVIALGIHRRQTEEEHRNLLGSELYKRIRPVDHDSRDKDSLVFFGKTARGTEVAVNAKVAEADKILLTGAVSSHYYAGFGGGRKSIMPGVCSFEANLQSHLLVFNPPPATGRNVNARVARLSGNPVHEDMLEAAKMVSPHFMVNTIVAPEKGLVAAFVGDFVAAHRAACVHYVENLSVVASEPADVTIVSCGGYPKDINFIQAHKAIHSAYSVTKPGGWMIVLAECGDGLGYPGFIDWFRFEDLAEFERELRASYEIYGQTAYAALEKATTINIVLVSNLNPVDVEQMKMWSAGSFEEAYHLATRNLPEKFTTYIVPAASNTLFLTEGEYANALASVSGDLTSEQREAS